MDYFRRSADHRLLYGGRANYSGLSHFDGSEATRQRMVDVFPQLADVKLEFAWGGEVDITLNRAPHFGRLAPNVYFLQGVLRTWARAHRHRRQARGRKPSAGQLNGSMCLRAFLIEGFPGGMLMRRPALVLAMMYYRLRDML